MASQGPSVASRAQLLLANLKNSPFSAAASFAATPLVQAAARGGLGSSDAGSAVGSRRGSGTAEAASTASTATSSTRTSSPSSDTDEPVDYDAIVQQASVGYVLDCERDEADEARYTYGHAQELHSRRVEEARRQLELEHAQPVRWAEFTSFSESDLDDSHLELEHVELIQVPSSYVIFLDDDDAEENLFEYCARNSLFEEDVVTHNPLFEEEDEIAINPLYEDDVAVLNPLYDDALREEDLAGLVSRRLLGDNVEDERIRFEEMRRQLPLSDRVVLGKTKKSCFSGEELVEFVLRKAHAAIIAELGTLGVVGQLGTGSNDTAAEVTNMLSSTSSQIDDDVPLSSSAVSPVVSPQLMSSTPSVSVESADGDGVAVSSSVGSPSSHSALSPLLLTEPGGSLEPSHEPQNTVDAAIMTKLFSREQAVSLCQHMLQRFMIQHVDTHEDPSTSTKFSAAPAQLYHFIEDAQDMNALNSTASFHAPEASDLDDGASTSPLVYERYEPAPEGGMRSVHSLLRRQMQDLLDAFAWQNDGRHAASPSGDARHAERYLSKHIQLWDYPAVKESQQAASLLHTVRQLRKCDPLELEAGPERLAFFLNLYNVMYLHALIRLGRPTNMLNRQKFLQSASYVVGRFVVTLEQIERLVLLSPARSTHSKALFAVSQRDAQLSSLAAYDRCDPRVHFALITGSISSPPLVAYSHETVDAQLTQVTSTYLQHEKFKIDMDQREVTISQQLSWWTESLGQDIAKRLAWAQAFLDADQQGRLKVVMDDATRPYRVRFASYNWGLNSMLVRWCSPRILDELALWNEDQSNLFGASALRKARRAGAKSPRRRSFAKNGEVALVTAEDDINVELRELINVPAYRRYLQLYAEKEQSAENIYFYNAVEQYKAINSFDERAEMANRIFAKYLAPRAEFEINVPAHTLSEVKTMLGDTETRGMLHMFDRAVTEIEKNMNDIFVRFQQSSEYATLVKSIYLDVLEEPTGQAGTDVAAAAGEPLDASSDADELSSKSGDGDVKSPDQVPGVSPVIPALRLSATSAHVRTASSRHSVSAVRKSRPVAPVQPSSSSSSSSRYTFESVITWAPPEM